VGVAQRGTSEPRSLKGSTKREKAAQKENLAWGRKPKKRGTGMSKPKEKGKKGPFMKGRVNHPYPGPLLTSFLALRK